MGKRTNALRDLMTSEDDFKARFVAIMQDVREAGAKDTQAMWLVGSIAAGLLDRAKVETWKKYASSRTPMARRVLLEDLEGKGKGFTSQGRTRHQYAIQLIAASLIAHTVKDQVVKSGNALLDELIDGAVAFYRRNATQRAAN
jgi:hypothetical protein